MCKNSPHPALLAVLEMWDKMTEIGKELTKLLQKNEVGTVFESTVY